MVEMVSMEGSTVRVAVRVLVRACLSLLAFSVVEWIKSKASKTMNWIVAVFDRTRFGAWKGYKLLE
jgi:hypothetical protein